MVRYKIKEIKHIDNIAEKMVNREFYVEKHSGLPPRFKVPYLRLKWRMA